MPRTYKLCGGSEAAAAAALPPWRGFSPPSPSPDRSVIKLERFRKGLSCLCLHAREWSPIVLVPALKVCWQVSAGEWEWRWPGVVPGPGALCGWEFLGSGRESATIAGQALMGFFPLKGCGPWLAFFLFLLYLKPCREHLVSHAAGR